MRKCIPLALAAVLSLMWAAMGAQPQQTSSAARNSATPAVLPDLVKAERQFWDAWKNGKPEVFENNMADDAVFFGQYGISPKREIVEEQKESVHSCKVRSYTLTNSRAIRIDDNAYILLYEAKQDAICGGAKVNPLMLGSSVYVRRNGKWMNIFRSEVPLAK
ncbi:MAG: nuclear transport factor 2 family protein [Candidatus Acidiferrales bacterium]